MTQAVPLFLFGGTGDSRFTCSTPTAKLSVVKTHLNHPDMPVKMLSRATSAAVSRRVFLRSAGLVSVVACHVPELLGARPPAGGSSRRRPLVVSTWPFGRPANEQALDVVRRGGTLVDAVEQGICLVEADANVTSVGIGGAPNAAGVVQLDACIMEGRGHRAGSVAALEDVLHPISVARRVMDKTPHVMLVGPGARAFALEQGFATANLLTETQRREWQAWRAKQREVPRVGPAQHDTIALLILGADGNLAGGCSTSGWAYKLPGRVGDSPIIGSGLYVDNTVGAAGATGLGENVMRYCGAFRVVEAMRRGASPLEACRDAVRQIARLDPKGMNLDIHFIALDRRGRFGAAGTTRSFDYAVACPDFSEVRRAQALTSESGGPVGGNRPKS